MCVINFMGSRSDSNNIERLWLPPVAKNDFLHPVEAAFRGLGNDMWNTNKTLINQCIYGNLRWTFEAS